nr:hypothetical transcript [Hymenolepis microstoma]
METTVGIEGTVYAKRQHNRPSDFIASWHRSPTLVTATMKLVLNEDFQHHKLVQSSQKSTSHAKVSQKLSFEGGEETLSTMKHSAELRTI